jgi:hypothetical protein
MTIALPRERWTARRWAAIVAGTLGIARREVPMAGRQAGPLTTL